MTAVDAMGQQVIHERVARDAMGELPHCIVGFNVFTVRGDPRRNPGACICPVRPVRMGVAAAVSMNVNVAAGSMDTLTAVRREQ